MVIKYPNHNSPKKSCDIIRPSLLVRGSGNLSDQLSNNDLRHEVSPDTNTDWTNEYNFSPKYDHKK